MKKLIITTTLFTVLFISCGKEIKETAPPVVSTFQVDKPAEIKISDKLKELLFNAIKGNDTLLVDYALNESEHIDYQFKNGETPLTLALYIAKTEIITKIIIKTKNFNLKNKKMNTPLHAAVKMKNFFILNLLLKKDININSIDKFKNTPLNDALYKRVPKFIIKLLIYGADTRINKRVEQGLLINNQEIKSLVKLINEPKKISNQLLNQAVKNGDINAVEYFLENFTGYQEILKKRNLLLTALNIESPKVRSIMMDQLLRRGANPNNQEGIAAIIRAVILEDTDAVAQLINYGADLTAVDDEELTALDYAFNSSNYRLVRVINATLFKEFENENDGQRYREILSNTCTTNRFLQVAYRDLHKHKRIKALLDCNL